ncbi:MAG: putative baseplate assembly protein, partial [Candidatus Aminicenantes bacterium]|nr:putative baseplate assembly protein [Candidatus Aminicenantes bacterium]
IDIGSVAALRRIVVYAQSERLELADVPVSETLEGHTLKLESLLSGLTKGRTIIVSGERAGNPGTWASEPAIVQNVLRKDGWTELVLAEDLANTFKLETATINANVAAAGHGESVQEILGSGDGSRSFQSFKLKQAPLTYRSASTPSGTETTLKVTVNDITWKEVENFLSSGPDDRRYVVRTDEEGTTLVRFGDGRNGARLPSGQNNVKAVYRKGLGLEGRVKKDRLSQLLTRSYGLKEVTNPCDAEGGDDPEPLELAKVNAPLKVRTLDRAVSLQDYEDFALAFAGIAKAWAIWIWEGEKKGIVLTVAEPPGKSGSSGAAGSALSPAAKLSDALDKAGPPFVPLRLVSYRQASFRVALRIKVLPEYQKDKVKAAAEKSLRAAFSFSARSLGQPVFLSEVLAVVQSVPGVESVDVNALYREGEEAVPNDRLLAAPPEVNVDGSWAGAELLTLDDEPLAELGDMP